MLQKTWNPTQPAHNQQTDICVPAIALEFRRIVGQQEATELRVGGGVRASGSHVERPRLSHRIEGAKKARVILLL